MGDKRKELVAFRYRIRARCGNNEFATSKETARACNIGARSAYEILGGMKRVSGKVFVDDAAERIFRAVKPRVKRCG